MLERYSISHGRESTLMACPSRVDVPQGCAGGSWHILVARETSTASGWKQSKEDRPAPIVAGQRARVRNYTLCEAPGASTPNRFCKVRGVGELECTILAPRIELGIFRV